MKSRINQHLDELNDKIQSETLEKLSTMISEKLIDNDVLFELEDMIMDKIYPDLVCAISETLDGKVFDITKLFLNEKKDEIIKNEITKTTDLILKQNKILIDLITKKITSIIISKKVKKKISKEIIKIVKREYKNGNKNM